jgi:DNA repair protein RadC
MENNQNLSVKSWAEEDRPREKLMLRGRQALTDAELLAIIIGSGNNKETAVQLSQRILLSVAGNLQSLGRLTVENLREFRGVGEAKAISIIAAMELARRRAAYQGEQRTAIRSSNDAYEYMISHFLDLPHEEFWCLFMNRRNEVISKFQLSKGSINGTVADIRIVFKKAVELLSSSVFLFHNHPSGSLNPSEADKQLTHKFIEAGALLDVVVLDHLIMTDNGYFSFADHGIMR